MPRAPLVRPARDWWVQIGSFRSRQAARAQVEAVSRQFASLLDAAEGSVEGERRSFQARFSGLTETAAKETCSAVRTRGLPCVATNHA